MERKREGKKAKERKNIESKRSVGDRNGKDEESEEKIREERGRSYLI